MLTVVTRQPCGQEGRNTIRIPVIITTVVLAVSIVVIVILTFVQAFHKVVVSPEPKHGIVLDAGSTRTTFYVYQWPAEKENNTGVVSETFRCEVQGPGIATYAQNPEEIPKKFDKCTKMVQDHIPAHFHNSTQLYLAATAGMRLLRLKNEEASNKILATIAKYFKSQSFDFRSAEIISGEDEGLYGWITVNYLMGNFLEKNLWNMWVHPNGVQTTGALDLGGASTQISFVPEEQMPSDTNDSIQVSLYGYKYTLYTHSFQCYGRMEAERRLHAKLLQESAYKRNVINPCYPRNYQFNFTLKEVFDSPCTANMKPSNYNPNDVVILEGTGDPLQCRNKVASLFDFKACDGKESCSFNGVYQPKLKGSFGAFAGFYYTANTFNLSGSFPLNTFNSSTWNFCSKEWSQLPGLLPHFDEMYARSQCFSAHYVYHLLMNGYKFTEKSWPDIQFIKEVADSSIAWSLGYMLNLTNQIPATCPLIHMALPQHIFVGIMVFFATMAFMCLLFFVYLYVSARKLSSSQVAFNSPTNSA
ncbi:PREDICTED: ectonucleoside triphosphate diphosphohydrolase 3 [Condylura cristata]|uniref:ectonucleoside triphosphate diphosphohydrolase 3 n=1 Tax=Condylura cristata TaxID=143302 RepID=UPI0003344BC8|nr:PREDICTED: ectonucleoside triphosphate diphosphohydrolase 3 [Condylura cristata]XP_012590491.1 PREDICTED: ectonucleoside triphosphate diphosphohydrolase 3 [Condylura cristata]